MKNLLAGVVLFAQLFSAIALYSSIHPDFVRRHSAPYSSKELLSFQREPPLNTPKLLNFAEFRKKYGRLYKPGTYEHDRREKIFNAAVAAIEKHNRKADRWFNQDINMMADRSKVELDRTRNYKPHHRGQNAMISLSNLSGPPKTASVRTLPSLPADHSWKGKLKSMDHVRDQGSCGSCWAVGTATVLSAHSELFGDYKGELSPQQIVECAPNPYECGGSGGCDGSTAELAMDHILMYGLQTEEDYPYKARDDKKCKEEITATKPTEVLIGGAKFAGYRDLRPFEVLDVKETLATRGPIAASIAADQGMALQFYRSGVFDSCSDRVINHLVTLVGYGGSTLSRYWVIQNSWGDEWGEGGFMRLARASDDAEEADCGVNNKPLDGSGCKSGPNAVKAGDTLRSCGACGILTENVVPELLLTNQGYWAKGAASQTRTDDEEQMSKSSNQKKTLVHDANKDANAHGEKHDDKKTGGGKTKQGLRHLPRR